MSKQPLISAIIIFLNEERFIEEAINSVFAQTYSHWELLLVDDGSTDTSTEIARRYAEQYPDQVRYLEHEEHQNRGMSATRNLGIRNAKGEYITFLDADDIWLPEKLERQLAILESHPEAGMVCGPTQNWFSWTGNPEDSQKDSIREIGVQPNRLYKPSTLLTLFLRKEGALVATCSVLLRRKLIEAIGGFEEAFQGMFEDQVFFAKVYLKVPVFVESGCWDRYRHHPDSTCYLAMRTGQFHASKPNPTQLAFLNWLADYMSKQGIEDAEVWQALQQRLWPYQYPLLYLLQKIKNKLKFQFIRLSKFVGQIALPISIRT